MTNRRASRRGNKLGKLFMVVGAALGLASAGPAVAAASGPTVRTMPPPQNLRALYDVGVSSNVQQSAASVPNTVPNFTTTVNDHGKTFTYSMVGKDPSVSQSTPSTTVSTIIVPLIIKLATGDTFDPTVGDACDSTSAITRTLNSPLFVNHAYSFGGTSVGNTQYIDAFQRSNFWTYTKPGGINPGYHVLVNPTTIAAQTVNVPAQDGVFGNMHCGKYAQVDVNWLDNYFRKTLIPKLKPLGVNSTNFPMFVVENVVEYITAPAQCCVLGFHGAYNSPASGGHVQTYAISLYDNTALFSGSKDIGVATHEVGEWMDDPFINNPTKPWGHVGQVSGCQSNLEVGDPLSGTSKPVTVSGKTYKVQELAFFSWFYHQSPSLGVNGWFSNFGKFRTSAKACH